MAVYAGSSTDSTMHRATCGTDGAPCPTGEHGWCPGCRADHEVPVGASRDEHDEGCPAAELAAVTLASVLRRVRALQRSIERTESPDELRFFRARIVEFLELIHGWVDMLVSAETRHNVDQANANGDVPCQCPGPVVTQCVETGAGRRWPQCVRCGGNRSDGE